LKKKVGVEKMMEHKYDEALNIVPEMTNLLLENDHVRVYDVWFKPGQKATMHTHPNHVIYVLNDGKMKITSSNGKPQEITLKAGQALWMDATAHIAENTGKTDVHNLIVELKK
jgi:quercetin dioxygenase-like cupin family protein